MPRYGRFGRHFLTSKPVLVGVRMAAVLRRGFPHKQLTLNPCPHIETFHNLAEITLGNHTMMKQILGLLYFLAVTMSHGATLFVKLIDDRERPVMNAEFFWKHPQHDEYRSFRESGMVHKGNGQMLRHREGFVFNYEIGKSVVVGGDTVDIKIVADGYYVKVIRERIPDGSDPGETQILVTMDIERPRHNESRANQDHVNQSRPEPKEQDRLSAGILAITVLAENDQRTPNDDRLLPGATISATVEASGRKYEASTDSGGEATLLVPEQGRTTVEITCPGYRPKHWRTNIEAGRTERQRIALLRER